MSTTSHWLTQQYTLPQKQKEQQQQQQQRRLGSNTDNVNDSSEPSTTRQLLESRDSPIRTPLAWKIVSSAFQETYVHLKQCCDDKRAAIQRDYSSSSSSSSSSTTTQQQDQEQQHKEQQVLVECLAETRATSGSSWPWWFQTLLRDASPYSTLHASFHDLWMRLPPPSQTNNNGNHVNHVNQHDSNAFVPPPSSLTTPTTSLLQFCAIEKISSSTWRSVQCKLNYNDKSNKAAIPAATTAAVNASTMRGSDGGGREQFFLNRTKKDRVTIGGVGKCILQLTNEEADYYQAAGSTNNKNNDTDTTKHAGHSHDNEHYKRNHKHIHRAVFLRDPLERFLSGYLDKCVRSVREKHCEPNQLFSVSDATIRQAEHAASGRGDQRQNMARRYDRTHQNRTLTTDLIPPLHKGGRIVGRSTSPSSTTTTNTITSSSSGMNTPPVLNASHYHFLLDAYVELFPLSWNVHFYPQSLYCNGLFLDLLKDYDFIGKFFSGRCQNPAGMEGG